MQTIRIISNISYNTPAYFTAKVNELVKGHKLDWCYWIVHQADTDETKQHIHFVCKPACRIDTTALREYFFEVDPTNDLPLTCTSKFNACNSMDDWLLYAVHDPAYLASKGQWRNIQYSYEDIQATDRDALRGDWNSIDRRQYERLNWLYKAVEEGKPFYELVQSGLIPIAQRSQYQYQYNDIASHMEHRITGRKQAHEDETTVDDTYSTPAGMTVHGYDNEPNPFDNEEVFKW